MSAGASEIIQLDTRQNALLLTVAADQLTALREVDRFDLELKKLLEQRRERIWVIDFRGVTFMVTPAINTLLHVRQKLNDDGGKLVLTGLSAEIQHIFEIMKLDEVITFAADAEAALKEIEGRA